MQILSATESGEDLVVQEAARVLLSGGLVVFPTETVYGLACRMDDPSALERIYEVKTRERGKPIAILAAEVGYLVDGGFNVNQRERALADRFWPGPLTLVLNRGASTEGVRVPDHLMARKIIAASGGVLRVTSANQSGEPDALNAQMAAESLAGKVDLIVDGGAVAGGVPSTVVKSGDVGFDILREGAISQSSILEVVAHR